MEMLMFRIYSTSIEVAAIATILIPILYVYHRIIFHNGKKLAVYLIFTFYLAAMCFLVGFPNIAGIKMVWSYQMIPLHGMLSDITNSFLNVLLFVPLGIFVPCLWRKYRSFMRTGAFGLLTSLVIELSQIFTFRATDVNDLITNVTGTIIGYLIGRVIIQMVPQLNKLECRESELYLLYGTVGVVMFFLQPFILL